MNIELRHETLHQSETGQITFGQVIGTLLGVGVESYFADLVKGVDTFYMPNGETHTEKMSLNQSEAC
jgi:uncharacterized protein YbcV (DUF1398 family)